MPLRVSVVVCTRDRPEMLETCLEHVQAALRPGDDLLVVDSASRGSATAEVARRAGARLVRSEVPGLSRARNLGVASSQGDLIAFTDDDCRPRLDWVSALAGAFDVPQVGFVLGAVLGEGEGAPMSVSGPAQLARTVQPGEDTTQLGHGANMAVRRAAWQPLGGFDPLLGAGGRFRAAEDKDAFWRLQQAGWWGQLAPEAVVTHSLWRGRRAAAKLTYGYGRGEGARVAKIAKADRLAARPLLRAQLLEHGLSQAGRDLRAGYATGVALCLLRTAGVAAGAVEGRRRPMAGPNYADDLSSS